MGLDDELYLRKIEMDKENTSGHKIPGASRHGKGRSPKYKNAGFASCPNCCTPLPIPLASGRQVCRSCGWLGTTARPIRASTRAIGRWSVGFGWGFVFALAVSAGLGLYSFQDAFFTKPTSAISTNRTVVQKLVLSPERPQVTSAERSLHPRFAAHAQEAVRVAQKPAPANLARTKPIGTAHLPPDLEQQVRSGTLSPKEAQQLAGGKQRLEAIQRVNDNWPSPGRITDDNTGPIAQAYPPAYAPRPQAPTRYTRQSAVQALSFVTNACGELLSSGCEGNYSGQTLSIIATANLTACLQETGACPGAYSKRGVVRELYSIQRKAQNIAPGLPVQIIVDGQAVNLR